MKFPLLCDTKHEVALAYGAWAEGGPPYPSRKSFVIGTDGKLEYVFNKVNPTNHAADLLDLFTKTKK